MIDFVTTLVKNPIIKKSSLKSKWIPDQYDQLNNFIPGHNRSEQKDSTIETE